MGLEKKHPSVKLVLGLIYKEEAILKKCLPLLVKKFGEIDFSSEVLDFNQTSYYENEFGRGLKKKFISFKKLIGAQDLAKIKLITNAFERKITYQRKRLINIDPGYLNLSKFVLATTKDFSHRIYLKRGILAEITLIYKNHGFKPLEWTYPDYRTPEYLSILDKIRENYAKQIKK